MVRARLNHSCSHGICHVGTLLTQCVKCIDHIRDSRRSCVVSGVWRLGSAPRARFELTACTAVQTVAPASLAVVSV